MNEAIPVLLATIGDIEGESAVPGMLGDHRSRHHRPTGSAGSARDVDSPAGSSSSTSGVRSIQPSVRRPRFSSGSGSRVASTRCLTRSTNTQAARSRWFQAGYTEPPSSRPANPPHSRASPSRADNLTRALRRARTVERTACKLTTFLATTGSTAPFIGLFGTVWGILRAFQKIGATGQATVATVGPDIAHALIATAVGLAAAIPAVIAFNFFNSRIRVLATEMDNFSDDFLNIVKRHRQSG